MQTITQSAVPCKSIFKSTSVEELSKEFNLRWMELINRLEQLKCSSELRQKEQEAHEMIYSSHETAFFNGTRQEWGNS